MPELEIKKGEKVVVRMEPAPSGHLHLGHLFPIVANYEFKKKYDGKFILRISDTNPDNIDIKNYDKVIEDIKWICDDDVDEIVYQSDRNSIYYKYLRQLFLTENAYVCECDGETFKAYTDAKEECPHAKETRIDQKPKFDKFMDGKYKAGEAVIRFRADIQNKNPALRSFGLARINSNKHARVGDKYKVWPTMHLAVSIDDPLMNLTHVIRGKDHEINMERQMMVHKALGMKSPIYFHIGRMKFEDMELSKTKLTELIEEGKFVGWDDPRVPSIISHKRRGYKAKAFRDFILSLGISKRDSKITKKEYYKGLDYFNKQILEKEADRFFCVTNPKKVKITNTTEYKNKEIEIAKHPDDKSRGMRKIKTNSEYLIDGEDFEKIQEDQTIRLMHFANFKVKKKSKEELELELISIAYDKNLKLNANIHFAPTDAEKIKIITNNNETLDGYCEKLTGTKIDNSYQFERYGFVRFDSENKNKEKVFYFTHR